MFKKMGAIVICVFLSLNFCACSAEYGLDGYSHFSEQVFASGIIFSADLRGGKTKVAYSEMQNLMKDINDDMSLSLSSSALSEFNNSTVSGYSVEIKKFTYDVIQKSLQISKNVDGAFNIAVTNLSKLWNVNSDGINKYGGAFNDEQAPEPPPYDSVLQLKQECDLSDLECYEQDGKYYIKKLAPNLRLDLGAIAKGYSADECLKIAQKYNVKSGIINISGNLCLLGKWYRPQIGDVDWEIGVTNPRPRGSLAGDICAIKLKNSCSIVTSGDYSRFYDYSYPESSVDDTLFVCHIINPQTGMPINIEYDENSGKYKNSSSGIISATVITQNSAEADAYATAICALGYDNGVKLMQKLGLKGILITQDSRIALVGISQTDSNSVVALTQLSNYPNMTNGTYTITEY